MTMQVRIGENEEPEIVEIEGKPRFIYKRYAEATCGCTALVGYLIPADAKNMGLLVAQSLPPTVLAQGCEEHKMSVPTRMEHLIRERLRGEAPTAERVAMMLGETLVGL